MPYLYPTVEINSQVFDVYADTSMIEVYLSASFSGWETWQALTELQQKQLAVSVTRLMDRQCWAGEPTEEVPNYQTLQWPRKNTGIDGVVDDVIPIDIINGAMELVSAIAGGSDVESTQNPGAQKLQSLGAGSVSLTWFAGTDTLSRYYRFPQAVQELFSRYLCGDGAASMGIASPRSYDTCEPSVTHDKHKFNSGI